MNNYQEILNQLNSREEELKIQEKELIEQRAALRTQTLEQVKSAISTFGFTAEEIGIKVKAAAVKKETPKEKKKIPPKYRTPNGIEWTGRGIMPKAMTKWLEENGVTKEEIKI